ncbi:dihydrofolate reductase [Rhodococcus spongiicola]|uniref:Dihydrofolate reductase n=1 Tax=Rhodococcus spongiicola TaxID=2487352 RepID=A0A438B5W9_9NOCA|nr:dihydrofolate reductase [Rhodococcus spongiicola]RVW06355.1 dihydrofolate reductase [Rhodococcus spongiicola]
MIGLIWGQTLAGVIGKDNAIPWRIPEDMSHFKETTLGHPVVMGRLTWDSLPSRFRPLPGRRNIVITRQEEWSAEGALTAHGIEEALTLAGDTAWVMGGSQIYTAAMPFADLLSVTEIDADIDGDAFAPKIGGEWVVGDEGDWRISDPSGLRYRFLTYVRA